MVVVAVVAFLYLGWAAISLAFQLFYSLSNGPLPPRKKSRDHQKQLRAAFPIRSGTDGRIGEVRACCAWALAHLGQLSKRCGLPMSNGDIAEFKETGDVFLQCYTALALHALQNGVCRWALKPKHHQLQHSLEEVGIDKLNPSFLELRRRGHARAFKTDSWPHAQSEDVAANLAAIPCACEDALEAPCPGAACLNASQHVHLHMFHHIDAPPNKHDCRCLSAPAWLASLPTTAVGTDNDPHRARSKVAV